MCWTGTLDDYKIAYKDVHVFKVLYKEVNERNETIYYAPLTGFQYELNKLYGTKELELIKSIQYKKNGKVTIEEGLHAFSFKCKPNIIYIPLKTCKINEYLFLFEKNYISVLSAYEEMEGDFELILLECIIPKGAKYYENEEGEIVSNYLIVTDKKINI